jgi:hypothetical protein
VVATEHDVGRPAGGGSPWLHRLFRPACGDRRLTRSLVDRELSLAGADYVSDHRPRRRSLWAFVFNAMLGAKLGVFHYGRVIEGLAIREGTKHQYPLYDALAMGVQMMVFTYLLGRTDRAGRTLVEVWADSRAKSRLQASLALDRVRHRHRSCRASFGLRASPRDQGVGSANRGADRAAVRGSAESAALARSPAERSGEILEGHAVVAQVTANEAKVSCILSDNHCADVRRSTSDEEIVLE